MRLGISIRVTQIRHLQKFVSTFQQLPLDLRLCMIRFHPSLLKTKKYQTYSKENGINIVHLVQEAKILVLVSSHDVLERGFHHTIISSMMKKTSSLDWDEKVIEKMLEMEKNSIEWQDEVHKMVPFVQNHCVAYESILRKEKLKMLFSQIASFV